MKTSVSYTQGAIIAAYRDTAETSASTQKLVGVIVAPRMPAGRRIVQAMTPQHRTKKTPYDNTVSVVDSSETEEK